LLFLLGQRPGYFAHQKVIADSVESNLTSVRRALFELRDAGLVSWDLIPPHHALPTGKYTRTNVNRYFVDADALLLALGGDQAAGPSGRVAPTHPDSAASTGTDPKFEQDAPLPPKHRSRRQRDEHVAEGEIRFPDFPRAQLATGQPNSTGDALRSKQGGSPQVPSELGQVLAAWRALDLSEPDDRSVRALRNRQAEGATIEQLTAAVQGAKHDPWLRQRRAQSPFAVVFTSLSSIARYSAAGREHAQQAEGATRRLAAERRPARDLTLPRPPGDAQFAALPLSTILADVAAISAGTRTSRPASQAHLLSLE
jgi:hypothetical protein